MGYDIELTRAPIPAVQSVLAAWRSARRAGRPHAGGPQGRPVDCPPNKLWRSKQIGAGIGDPGPCGASSCAASRAGEIIDELAPIDGEMVIDKATKGAFSNTDLDLVLRNRGVHSLVITGITTDVCVTRRCARPTTSATSASSCRTAPRRRTPPTTRPPCGWCYAGRGLRRRRHQRLGVGRAARPCDRHCRAARGLRATARRTRRRWSRTPSSARSRPPGRRGSRSPWRDVRPGSPGSASRHGTADLPLHGVPFAMKDNIDVAGTPTTAACPPSPTCPVTRRIRRRAPRRRRGDPVGKTNIDQFATGLFGTRSPTAPARTRRPALHPGGSSSGSAVVVARHRALRTRHRHRGLGPRARGVQRHRRLQALARRHLHTRRRAGLPQPGLRLAAGPAAPAPTPRSCSRSRPAPTRPIRTRAWRLASASAQERAGALVPARPRVGRAAGRGADFRRRRAGGPAPGARRCVTPPRSVGEIEEIGFAPFAEAAGLLYGGPWLAERFAGVGAFIAAHPRRGRTRRFARVVIADRDIDAVPGLPRRAPPARARPRLRRHLAAGRRAAGARPPPPCSPPRRSPRSRLGARHPARDVHELRQPARPVRGRGSRRRARRRPAVRGLADRACRRRRRAAGARRALARGGRGARAGRPGRRSQEHPGPAPAVPDRVALAVVGAHLSGEPLNGRLVELGARLRETVRSAPTYRLYALPDTVPAKPGLVGGGARPRATASSSRSGSSPRRRSGSCVAGVPAPLSIGTITLADGRAVKGFLCESSAVTTAPDITAYGGWRAYREALSPAGRSLSRTHIDPRARPMIGPCHQIVRPGTGDARSRWPSACRSPECSQCSTSRSG